MSLCGTWERHEQPATADDVSERLTSTPALRHPGVPALPGAPKQQRWKPGKRTEPHGAQTTRAPHERLQFVGWDSGCGARHTECESSLYH